MYFSSVREMCILRNEWHSR